MAEMTIYPSLKGKTVLITGGGSGIGEALTRAFVAQGCKVGFLDYDKEVSQRLVDELGSDNLHFEYCDLKDIDALKACVKAVSAALGNITVLVNNAARDDRHSLWNQSRPSILMNVSPPISNISYLPLRQWCRIWRLPAAAQSSIWARQAG